MVNIPFPTRLQRLRGKRSIPGAGIFALWPVGKAFWWLVEKGGDLDFIATYTPKASKMLPVIGAWMWDHGWLVLMPTGLAWLGWLVMRPEKAAKSEQPTGRILDAEDRAERTEIQLRELAEQYRTREGELQNATAKIQELSREVREQKRLAGNAEGAAVLCKEQLANAVAEQIKFRSLYYYGFSSTPLPELSAEECGKLEGLKTGLAMMLEAAYRTWDGVRNRMGDEQSDPSFGSHVAAFVRERVVEPLKRAHCDLLLKIKSPNDSQYPDAQTLLFTTWKCYWLLRAWIGEFARLNGLDMTQWPDLQQWRDGATQFNQAFRNIIGTKPSEGLEAFQGLQQAIRTSPADDVGPTGVFGILRMMNAPKLPPGPFPS